MKITSYQAIPAFFALFFHYLVAIVAVVLPVAAVAYICLAIFHVPLLSTAAFLAMVVSFWWIVDRVRGGWPLKRQGS